jgi:hypothetical protein
MSSSPRPAEELGRREPGLLTNLAVCGVLACEGAVVHDHVSVGVLQVVVGAEAEVVVLELGRGVDPSALVSAERPLLVVARDDVLAKLRSDGLDPEARVPDHREVPQDRMPTLDQVMGGDGRHSRQRRCPHLLHAVRRSLSGRSACLTIDVRASPQRNLPAATVRRGARPVSQLLGSPPSRGSSTTTAVAPSRRAA